MPSLLNMTVIFQNVLLSAKLFASSLGIIHRNFQKILFDYICIVIGPYSIYLVESKCSKVSRWNKLQSVISNSMVEHLCVDIVFDRSGLVREFDFVFSIISAQNNHWLLVITSLTALYISHSSHYRQLTLDYREISSVSRTLVGNKFVDHSDVVRAPVRGTLTTTPFST